MSASPNWTKEEIEILKEVYPRLGKCEELQKLFPTRPLQAIALKANRLGVKVISNIRIGRTNQEYLDLIEKTNFVPLEVYRGSTVPILHMCGICDHEWLVRPQQVLKVGAKCPVCDLNNRFVSIDKVDAFIKAAECIRLSEYTGSLNSITLQHKCGHKWNTAYSYIQQGSGCPVCNKGFGYSRSKENMPSIATIYLLKLEGPEFSCYKIGVTSRDLSIRLKELKSELPLNIKISTIHTSKDSGVNILKKESNILSNYLKYKSPYTFNGYTELLEISADIELIKRNMNENI